MIADSSSLIAILLHQEGHDRVEAALAGAAVAGVGAPTLTETGIVLASRLGAGSASLLARLVEEAGLSVIPFTEVHVRAAVDAWRRFGKGRHPAALNFGDCLTYATAQVAAQPLLCLGEDFTRTDLELVSL